MEKQYFTFNQLTEELKLSNLDKDYVWQSLTSWERSSTQNPNHIIILVHRKISKETGEANPKSHTLSLLPSAIVSYVDYLEIVEARKTSKNAFIISLFAIGISIAIGAVQIYYQVATG